MKRPSQNLLRCYAGISLLFLGTSAAVAAPQAMQVLKPSSEVTTVISEFAQTPMALRLLSNAAAAMATASADPSQQASCAHMLVQFSKLSDEEFTPTVGGCEQAWDTLLRSSQVQASMIDIAPALLPRFAKYGNVFTLERLIRAANENPKYAGFIDSHLQKLVESPVPPTGLAETRQDYLLIAALRAGDVPRARNYLNTMKWPADASPEQIGVAQLWREAFEVHDQFIAGNITGASEIRRSISQAISLFHRFDGLSQNRADKVYGRDFVTQSASAFLLQTKIDPQSAIIWIAETKDQPSARVFWLASFSQIHTQFLFQPERLEQIRPLYQSFSKAFDIPNYELNAWLVLASDPRIRGKQTSLELRYAHNALAAASDDAERAQAFQTLATIYANAGKFEEGRRDLLPFLSGIAALELRSRLERMVNHLESLARGNAPGVSRSADN